MDHNVYTIKSSSPNGDKTLVLFPDSRVALADFYCNDRCWLDLSTSPQMSFKKWHFKSRQGVFWQHMLQKTKILTCNGKHMLESCLGLYKLFYRAQTTLA